MTTRYCSLAQQPTPEFAPGLAAERRGALIGGSRMWVNGTVLHYYFFDADNAAATDTSVIPVPGTGERRRVPWAGAKEQQDVVRECFREWRGLGIGVDFAEVRDRSEAELRIGFQPGDGSWSAVGRDALTIGLSDRTMNFGWDLTAPGERGTALHEIGHALGMLHEHQSPFALRSTGTTRPSTPSWRARRTSGAGTGHASTSCASSTRTRSTAPSGIRSRSWSTRSRQD